VSWLIAGLEKRLDGENYKGLGGLSEARQRMCILAPTRGSVACPAISEEVIVKPVGSITLTHRVE
jgi:hypothetical protein